MLEQLIEIAAENCTHLNSSDGECDTDGAANYDDFFSIKQRTSVNSFNLNYVLYHSEIILIPCS